MRRLIATLLQSTANRLWEPPPSDDLRELRARARMAWNNWPDNANSRKQIEAQEQRDQHSARAWDRVIEAVRRTS